MSACDSLFRRPGNRNGRDSHFPDNLRKIIGSNIRSKPNYTDCWLIGTADNLEIMEEYDFRGGHAVIGTAPDGETEYNLTPCEYTATDLANTIVEEALNNVRDDFRINGGRIDRQTISSAVADVIDGRSRELARVLMEESSGSDLDMICDIVYRYSGGLGVFDVLLADSKLEDIYIDAPCDKNRVHVTLSGVNGKNSHIRCRTNLLVEKTEIANLVNVLKRESGLPFCEVSPILETDLKKQNARATVVGYPMSPNGDAVAIRRRSDKPWTVTRLIANGTITKEQAGLLSFLVQNRTTFLICGARGAGKSSLLSAMMFEMSLGQRIVTIEDTLELPAEAMRSVGYKVQTILVDERMPGDSRTRSAEALRLTLRLGESALVIGEVRSEEARVLYESMRIGKAGSSILGTIHGDSAKSVFERVVHDMGISEEAFMATDVLITMSTFRDPRTKSEIRKVSEIVCTGSKPGEFITLDPCMPDCNVPVIRRAMNISSMDPDDVKKNIRSRSLLHGYLADIGKNEERYLSPKWVAYANNFVDRMTGKDPEDVLASFRQKLKPEDRS